MRKRRPAKHQRERRGRGNGSRAASMRIDAVMHERAQASDRELAEALDVWKRMQVR